MFQIEIIIVSEIDGKNSINCNRSRENQFILMINGSVEQND